MSVKTDKYRHEVAMSKPSIYEDSRCEAFVTNPRRRADRIQGSPNGGNSLRKVLVEESGHAEVAFDIETLSVRLLDGGQEYLEDVDLLEMIISIDRSSRSPRSVAKSLLERFECFGRVMHVSAEELASIDGIGRSAAMLLKLVQAAALRLLKPEASAAPVFACWDQLTDYLSASLTFAEVEQVFTLYLDARNRLIANESQGRGTVRHAPFYPREVIRRALALNACGLILVHNHPGGDPTPSLEDIACTKDLIAAGAPLEITVHDHLIIGRNQIASFRHLQII
jgi:DNA repair protein RadC